MTYIAHYHSPLGEMTLASDGTYLTGLWFDNQKYFAYHISQLCVEKPLPIFQETCKWLDGYFKGSEPKTMPPIHMEGTPFRRSVWEILRSIPYGETITYGQIAQMMAEKRGLQRMSAQAVGGAVGHNPISILVPCHRVVGTDGSLTGYAGGVERKRALLKLEQGI